MAKRGRKRKSTKKRVFKYNNALIGLFLAIEVLSSSGVLDVVIFLLQPILKLFNIIYF